LAYGIDRDTADHVACRGVLERCWEQAMVSPSKVHAPDAQHAEKPCLGYTLRMPASQLIPRPELAPPGIAGLLPADRIRLWAQLVDEGDQFIYDGFRQRLGSDEAARQACLEWLERRNAESTAAKIRMLREIPAGGK
jgi:hypothetical protein